jgi:cytoskeletal protein CcmA (bactofilin family)
LPENDVSKRDDLSGFIDHGVRVSGELIFQNTFRIDGNFQGTIRSDDLLIVGVQGHVDADIEVGAISVSGVVKGRILARERLEVQKGGRVLADISTPALFIEEGGVLQGSCAVERPHINQPTEWKTEKETR